MRGSMRAGNAARHCLKRVVFFLFKKRPISGNRVITNFPFLLNAGCSRLFVS